MLKNIPFDEYLTMPGWSYSSIKNNGKAWTAPTQKMSLGTRVHQYLLEPEKYNHEDSTLIRPIAMAIKSKLGVLIEYLIPELAVTADFVHDGFCMAYKGRLDLCIPRRLVVDIKITEMPIRKGIEFFGYDKQLSGYAQPVAAPLALIVAAHPKSKCIEIANVPISTQWWEEQIKQKGEPIV